MTQSVVFLNDRFLASDEPATVPLVDRGNLFGDSVFATVRFAGGRLFCGALHVARLFAAARDLGIETRFEERAALALATEAALRVGVPDVTVRITLSRGVGGVGIGTIGEMLPTSSILARPTSPYPPSAYDLGADTMIVDVCRVPSACLPPRHKTGNYLPAILARRQLESRGLFEGIQRCVDGQISSGTVSNLFLVRAGELLTPHLASDCRPGITREALLELAPRHGLRAVEQRVTDDDLRSAEEAFFANTIMEALPIRAIEGIATYASIAVSKRLRQALREAYAGGDLVMDGAVRG
ncbi:MAG: Branched-chain amino acid aminotransferase [Labilithrix sp.]|nr:Branched-chain amino acid aminotransferase [Labilithrix sp.]